MTFVRCYLRVYLDPHQIQGELNKMIDLFTNVFWYIIVETCTALLHMLQYIPGAKEVYVEAVGHNLYILKYNPDHLMTSKRITNKMSSVMPFTFNAVELCVLTINEMAWTLLGKCAGH